MAQQNIHRNLESGQIYIPSWHSGLYTQRNPIFTPLSAMGLQIVSRYDTLADGLNMELSNSNTIQRRPGFPIFCASPIVSIYGSAGAETFTYVPPPSAPTVIPSDEDRIKRFRAPVVQSWQVTYVTPFGETTASVTTTLSLMGVYGIYTVTSPPQDPAQYATGYNVYFSNMLVNPTPIAIGTDYVVSFVGAPNTPAPTLSLYNETPNAPIDSSLDIFPLTFFSFKNNSGLIKLMMDTNDAVYIFDTNINNPLYMKQTAQQTSFAKVSDYVYMVDGRVAMKWDGLFAPLASITTPSSPPVFVVSPGQLTPIIGYRYRYAFKDGSGKVGFASLPSTSTGVLGTSAEATVIPDAPYQVKVNDAVSFVSDGGVVFTDASQLIPLEYVPFSPTTGQYTYDITGLYTFAAADLGRPIVITCVDSGFNGETITVAGVSSPDTNITTIEIFRNEDGGDIFYFLADISNPYPAPWTYADNTPDIGLDKTIVASQTGMGLTPMGIQTPRIAPSTSFSVGPLLPTVGYTYLFSGKNSYTGHVGTASPTSSPTGSAENKTTVEKNVIAPVTSIVGNYIPANSYAPGPNATALTIGCSNNFSVGQNFTMSGLPTTGVNAAAGILNGKLLIVLPGTTSTVIVSAFRGTLGPIPWLGGLFSAPQAFTVTLNDLTGLASLVLTVPVLPLNWQAGLPYVLGMQVINGPYVYTCVKFTGNALVDTEPPNLTYWSAVSIPSTFSYSVVDAANYISDGGVIRTSNGLPFTYTPSTPTAGEYTVNAGVYTFAAADAGAGFIPSYITSSGAGTAGVSINVSGSTFSDPQVDTIEIYRNADGGSLFYYLIDIPNIPSVSTWTFTDTIPDIGLNTDIVAPIDHSNDPPPVGANLLVHHMGRLWCAWKNYVQFSGGSDTTIGVGTEAWPPANVFEFPAKVTGLASTSAGLIVLTSEDMFVVYGTSLVSFYSTLYQKNFGVLSQNCIAQDGDLMFMYTTGRQLYMFSGQMSEVGFVIGDKFSVGFNPSTAILALHRHGPDSGLFISDGSTRMYKYRIDQQAWSPLTQVVGGSGALASIETAPGEYTLLTGQSISGAWPANYILGRNTLVFQDCGVSYPAYTVVGTLILSPPGTTSILDSVMTERMPVGSDAIVSVMCNEISAPFVVLPNPVNDPPLLAPQTTIIAKRHYMRAAQVPLPQQVRHVQVKIDFGIDSVKNELLSLALN